MNPVKVKTVSIPLSNLEKTGIRIRRCKISALLQKQIFSSSLILLRKGFYLFIALSIWLLSFNFASCQFFRWAGEYQRRHFLTWASMSMRVFWAWSSLMKAISLSFSSSSCAFFLIPSICWIRFSSACTQC